MINVERQIPKDELVARMRGVTMLHDKSVRPYENADIDIERVAIDEGLHLDNEGYKVGLIPPVVEEDEEHGLCLLDGTHRVYEARKFGVHTLNVLRISNVLPVIHSVHIPTHGMR